MSRPRHPNKHIEAAIRHAESLADGPVPQEQAGLLEYDFVLILCGVPAITREVEDALFVATDGEATLGMQQGVVSLDFTRKATSLAEAILSAIQDVRKANIGADVIRVDTYDLLTQGDIARRMNRPRQVVHQYISGKRGPGGFPPPACRVVDEHPLWRWCEVADWLSRHNYITEQEHRDVLELAIINDALELARVRRLHPDLTSRITAALGGA